jgi:aldehyde:ferredoxin oxidoreductase
VRHARPGCNRTIVTTISPQTKLMALLDDGRVLGAGAEIRRATTRSSSAANRPDLLVYLWINNDKVEIRDASHLQGQGRH